MQMVFFLSCFTITFINLDTESGSAGMRMYDSLTSYIHTGNFILSGIMAIGIFAPIIIILILYLIHNQKKYIYSSMTILISILSFVHFYSEYKDFVPINFKLAYSFYTLLISQLVSVFCFLGIFIINIKFNCKR